MWTFIALFALATAGALGSENSVRGIFTLVCPDGQVVTQIKSHYKLAQKDRLWSIKCKPVDASLTCFWSGFHNLYEGDLSYSCPADHVVGGVHSFYNSAKRDRSWNIRCCSAPKLHTFECGEYPMVNYWREDFDLQLPTGHSLTGLQTQQKSNNGSRDRRWSFQYCKISTEDTGNVMSLILAANEPVSSVMTQGDVFVPNSRNAIKCTGCLWPKSGEIVPVPYVVSDSYSSQEKDKISEAIKGFHLSTCARFVPRKNQKAHISIVKEGGCWSYVGSQGTLQKLSLGDGCVFHGLIQHELIHALGFFHEQSRSDRDIYVKINYENIKEDQEKNFLKEETNNLDVPYDYSSVMHYARTEFSKNGEDTITPLMSAQIGQRNGMSENDILKINKLYGCSEYLHKYGDWDNKLTEVVHRQCPNGQAVSGFTSFYSDEQRDRLWAVSCKAFDFTNKCRWTEAVNEYWLGMNFQCGKNEVIAGTESHYNRILSDRKWSFYCCSVPDVTLSNCQKTPEVNFYEDDFSWKVASDHFITGVKTSFGVSTRDRRWSFSYCMGNRK